MSDPETTPSQEPQTTATAEGPTTNEAHPAGGEAEVSDQELAGIAGGGIRIAGEDEIRSQIKITTNSGSGWEGLGFSSGGSGSGGAG